jgi:hypothetical protein
MQQPVPNEAPHEPPATETAPSNVEATPPPAEQASPSGSAELSPSAPPNPTAEAAEKPTEKTETPTKPSTPPKPQLVKKGRAISARGAALLNQDGEFVTYRKKCLKCGFDNTSTNRMPIRNGTTRTTFFCPKCRKLQPVEIQGVK